MNSAEFRTILESLGLTAEAAGNLFNVQGRTIRRWLSGEWPVPDDVAVALRDLDAQLERAVGAAEEQLEEAIEKTGGAPEDVVLVRYRTEEEFARYRPDMKGLPMTTHAALLNRVRLALVRRGIVVRIVYLDHDLYRAWLKQFNMNDSEASRSAWAASLSG